MANIEPRLLKGFRDYLPKEQIARSRMFEIIRSDFELFGFEPLETPVLEYEDVLTGKYGEEGENLMYRFKDNGDRAVAMRYDLTVPLARVVAQYGSQLPRPFKRYQIAPVWRAENTQKGRYREFFQCDADIVGAEIGVPDAECVALVERILLDLGLKNFAIKVSNRKILNAILQSVNIPDDKTVGAIRAIDKIEKIGAEGVVQELMGVVGLSTSDSEKLVSLISQKARTISELEEFVVENNISAAEGLQELKGIFSALDLLGVKRVEIDLSLARGLDYYTSVIFETILTESGESRKFGSVASGGRYDSLINVFAGKDVPAVGVSIGIDRLFSAMEDLKLVESQNTVDVLVLNLGDKFMDEYLKIVSELRQAGFSSEVYYTSGDMKKQFTYAEQKSVPLAILIGEEELKAGTVSIRDLKTREQIEVKREELVASLK